MATVPVGHAVGGGTRKAWVLKAGSVKNLRLQTLRQVERPGYGEVLIKVRCIGLNFADVFSVLGLYSATPRGEFVPGLEFSGVVAAVGASASDGKTTVEFASQEARERVEREASGFKPGDRVSGVVRFGAYSTSILAPAHQLRHIPKSWSFEQGAALNVQALTSFYGLKELGNVKPGQVVLVHSCAGGCGLVRQIDFTFQSVETLLFTSLHFNTKSFSSPPHCIDDTTN